MACCQQHRLCTGTPSGVANIKEASDVPLRHEMPYVCRETELPYMELHKQVGDLLLEALAGGVHVRHGESDVAKAARVAVAAVVAGEVGVGLGAPVVGQLQARLAPEHPHGLQKKKMKNKREKYKLKTFYSWSS